jgi:hypothetical protein
LINLSCPLCRAEINSFPENVVAQINANAEKYRQEVEEENFRQFVQQQQNNGLSEEFALNIFQGIMAALVYLDEQNIETNHIFRISISGNEIPTIEDIALSIIETSLNDQNLDRNSV